MSARSLLVVPAIDLRGGRCVRLRRGDPAQEKIYDGDPVERATAFMNAGATRLHVVDLDSAFESGANLDALAAICAVGVTVQTGGGIRRASDVEARLDAGASAVVVGTILVEDPPGTQMLVERYREKIIAAIDARGGLVATRGWRQQTAIMRDDLIRDVAAWGVERIVYTEIERDGMGSGYAVSSLAHVARVAPLNVTASGGARTLDDLLELRDRTPPNVDHAIVGSALYEGTIDLATAVTALR